MEWRREYWVSVELQLTVCPHCLKSKIGSDRYFSPLYTIQWIKKYCTCTVHTAQYSRCTCTVQYDILAISVKGEYLYHKLPPSISLKSQDLKISNINEKEALYILCTQTQTCATA